MSLSFSFFFNYNCCFYRVVVSCFMLLTIIGTAVAVLTYKKRKPPSIMVIDTSVVPEQIPSEVDLCSEACAINSSKKNYETISTKPSKQNETCCDTASLTHDTELNSEYVVQKRKG